MKTASHHRNGTLCGNACPKNIIGRAMNSPIIERCFREQYSQLPRYRQHRVVDVGVAADLSEELASLLAAEHQ